MLSIRLDGAYSWTSSSLMRVFRQVAAESHAGRNGVCFGAMPFLFRGIALRRLDRRWRIAEEPLCVWCAVCVAVRRQLEREERGRRLHGKWKARLSPGHSLLSDVNVNNPGFGVLSIVIRFEEHGSALDSGLLTHQHHCE